MTYLYIDVETVAPEGRRRILAEGAIKPDKRLKNPLKIDDNIAKKIAELPLNPAWAEPASIAWAWEDGEVECLPRTAKEDLENYLTRWHGYVTSDKDFTPNAMWVGHNVSYDLACLRGWHMRCRKTCPVKLPTRPYDSARTFCTMRSFYADKHLSLEDISTGLTGEGPIGSGADVAEHWEKGEMDAIIKHNKQDVHLTRALHRAMILA